MKKINKPDCFDNNGGFKHGFGSTVNIWKLDVLKIERDRERFMKIGM